MINWLDCIGPGWHPLVQPLLERAEREHVKVSQVKEKFGGLRFYVDSATDDFWDAIETAERKSFTICEECGAPGYARGGGWIKTLCDEHAQKELECFDI